VPVCRFGRLGSAAIAHFNVSPSNMSRVRHKAVTLAAVATVIVIGGFAVLLYPTHRLRVVGHLPPGEIAEIRKAVRDDLFGLLQYGTNSPPKWLPRLAVRYVWHPAQRAIFDAQHPIDVVEVRSTDMVVVWFRGPEMKAYVNGKEQGWFPRALLVTKQSARWMDRDRISTFLEP
jgi:hypothetical protein